MTVPELHQLFLKYPKACTDTRLIERPCIFFALRGENFNGNKFVQEALRKGAAYAVIDDPAYAQADRTVIVSDVLKTLQELATYHRHHCKAKVVALTGSNGKTTTKELLHGVIARKYNTIATSGNFNNHIGVPLSLLRIEQETEVAIIEMGANHIGEIGFLCQIAQPDYGFITNFGKAHLEGFGSEEGVIKGKSELYDYLIANDGFVFYNADDPIQGDKLRGHQKRKGFSKSDDGYYQVRFLGAHPFVTLEVGKTRIQTQLVGSYNFTNCGVALLVGDYFGVSLEEAKEALEAYVPENNRSQVIEHTDHRIVLDAYNANPTSMKAALENFSKMNGNQKVVFLGDMFELGDSTAQEHQLIADLAAKMEFQECYLIGENFSQTDGQSRKFNSFEELSEHLAAFPLPPSQILIKGSRGMALERILDILGD